MDKKKLAGYALMGLSSALLIGCQQKESKPMNNNGKNQSQQSALLKDSKNGSDTQTKMTPQEQSFYNRLNTQGKKDFEAMSHADREKAMKDANNCSGKNSCKGMGGCSTSEHSCKGQNSCKGQGGCSKTPDESVTMMKKSGNGSKNGNGNGSSSRY